MNIIKSIIAIIWLVWMVIVLGLMLFTNGPIEINVGDPVTGAWIFYGLTFGLPIILLVILRFERD